MGLEVYYRQDILRALAAARHATDCAVLAVQIGGDQYARGYREGYRKALTTIALAFGLVVNTDSGFLLPDEV